MRDGEDRVYLAAESSTYALRFLTPQSLTGSAHDLEKKSDCQKVIKSKSQSDTEKYQNPCTESRDIESTDP